VKAYVKVEVLLQSVLSALLCTQPHYARTKKLQVFFFIIIFFCIVTFSFLTYDGAGELSQCTENKGWVTVEAWFDFHQVYLLHNTQMCSQT